MGTFTYAEVNALWREFFPGETFPPENLVSYQVAYPDLAALRAYWQATYGGVGRYTYDEVNALWREFFPGEDFPRENLVSYQVAYPSLAALRAHWQATYGNNGNANNAAGPVASGGILDTIGGVALDLPIVGSLVGYGYSMTGIHPGIIALALACVGAYALGVFDSGSGRRR